MTYKGLSRERSRGGVEVVSQTKGEFLISHGFSFLSNAFVAAYNALDLCT